MQEQFAFTATADESRAALAAVSRSMTRQIANPMQDAVLCLAIYGLPLALAWFFFRSAFDEIYFTFALFIILVFVSSRFTKSRTRSIAERFAIPQTVRIDDEGVAQESDQSHSRWPWSSLRRIHILPTLVALEFADWSWAALPERLWADENARQHFVDEVRARAPKLLADLPSASVPTPFTLINVGAGFAAAELFLLQVFGVTWALPQPSAWPGAIAYAHRSVPQALGLLFAASLALAVGGFFAVRHVLRLLELKHPRAARCIAVVFIALFVAAVMASLLYRPCSC